MKAIDKKIIGLEILVIILAAVIFTKSEKEIQYCLIFIVLLSLFLLSRYYIKRKKELEYIRKTYPNLQVYKMSKNINFKKENALQATYYQLISNALISINNDIAGKIELKSTESETLKKQGYISVVFDGTKYFIELMN